MEHESTQARTTVGLVVGFALLLGACFVAIVAVVASINAERWVDHSMVVRQAVEQLFGTVQDAETGQRGYLLTDDASYLEPFLIAKTQLPALEGQLRQLTENSATHQKQLDELYPLIAAKMDELSSTVRDREEGRVDLAMGMVKSNLGHNQMERIRQAVRDFDQTELDALREHRANARTQRTVLTVVMIVLTLLAGVLAFAVAQKARRYANDMAAANETLRAEMLQRETAELQLRQSQKMEALGQLTGGVAHDFNNMLAIIVGNLEMLIRKLPEQEARCTTLANNALGGAMRAAELTKRLLAFSRQQPLQPKSVNVNQCVHDVSIMLRRSLGENIEIETVQGGGLWLAYVDRPQLESALLNLAVNARDAMNGVGKLTIETANAYLDRQYADAHNEVTPGQYVMVAVTDTGGGMLPEVISRAFDPFFTTKEVGKGTGLGLSQVHGFAKQSRGHVKIYSEIGVGTTIKIYLPRDTSSVEEKIAGTKLGVVPLHERRRVLVVEDDMDVRQFVISILQELGYETVEAASAASARDVLAIDSKITVMLTDVVMPGTNGKQLLDSLKDEYPDLIVVFMTGYTRNAIVHNGMLDPGVRLITKPFTIEEIGRELHAAIADEGSESVGEKV
jgi:signal transduction histidine kinase/ActR/RegA family two-component response regulator